MKNIEVKVLNPEVITDAEAMMVAMARLTQRGHTIKNMEDFEALIAQPYKESTAKAMCRLPHPTIQKFAAVNVAVVGLSRRALGQITRHQNEVKYMSSSLQYSDYSDEGQYVVPYEITKLDVEGEMNLKHGMGDFHKNAYLRTCNDAQLTYESAIRQGVPHDAASYMLPQGLRGVLLISATPYQLKHMISQRTCSRNTLETQYIMLKIWEQLYPTSLMFQDCGPTCTQAGGSCQEGRMSCGVVPEYKDPTEFLNDAFRYIRK